jgi:S1-C subfamily serine protease
MIAKSLPRTQAATSCVELPDAQRQGMPSPIGTGFFISPDGWFVTAAHVITEDNKSDGPVRQDINQGWLMKEARPPTLWTQLYQSVSFSHVIPECDFALLKVDFAANATKELLKGRSESPYIEVSKRQLDEGETVYAFEYPLPESSAQDLGSRVVTGSISLCPRVSSAIVVSTLFHAGVVMTGEDPQCYVLDKALKYGNSGGPIVAVETGRVHALCSSFQPVGVPQDYIKDESGNPIEVVIPSLYGVVSSLGNKAILDLLEQHQVPLFDE